MLHSKLGSAVPKIIIAGPWTILGVVTFSVRQFWALTLNNDNTTNYNDNEVFFDHTCKIAISPTPYPLPKELRSVSP